MDLTRKNYLISFVAVAKFVHGLFYHDLHDLLFIYTRLGLSCFSQLKATLFSTALIIGDKVMLACRAADSVACAGIIVEF